MTAMPCRQRHTPSVPTHFSDHCIMLTVGRRKFSVSRWDLLADRHGPYNFLLWGCWTAFVSKAVMGTQKRIRESVVQGRTRYHRPMVLTPSTVRCSPAFHIGVRSSFIVTNTFVIARSSCSTTAEMGPAQAWEMVDVALCPPTVF